MRLLSLILLALALGAALPACGDDDDDDGGGGGADTGTQPAVADVGRYCELTKELDEAGNEAFRELEQNPNASEEDFERVEREFVESNQEKIDELVRVAPEEIREDIGVLLAGLRSRAGQGPEVDEDQEQAAERRVTRFEDENCEE